MYCTGLASLTSWEDGDQKSDFNNGAQKTGTRTRIRIKTLASSLTAGPESYLDFSKAGRDQ